MKKLIIVLAALLIGGCIGYKVGKVTTQARIIVAQSEWKTLADADNAAGKAAGVSGKKAAANSDTVYDKHALEMVKYHQDWMDCDGVLTVKNNTGKTIHYIKGKLVYYDMKGTMLDYENISKNIAIAHGMTKCFDVDGCGYGDYYAYYESSKSSSHPDRVFRVEFWPEAYK